MRQIEIAVVPYKGNSQVVNELKSYVQNMSADDLFGAYVHGSLGTHEDIAYSDFDGLVITKERDRKGKQKTKNVHSRLHHSIGIMLRFDPLQHHGWFVMTEEQLQNYPQTYFPHELFVYAKSLLPDRGLEFQICLPEKVDYLEPLQRMISSLRRLLTGTPPKNLYALKGLLSQFMLLPALYVQARDQKGIFKKFSFAEARKDFSAEDWRIMDEVSQIRANWEYQMGPARRFLLTRPQPLVRKLATRYVAPPIPRHLQQILNDDFYNRMGHLVEQVAMKCP